jgi:hypothetical protein
MCEMGHNNIGGCFSYTRIWTIKYLDVKITHLNGNSNEELYMLQVKGYII